jgi:DNA polymerase III delta prime subunit
MQILQEHLRKGGLLHAYGIEGTWEDVGVRLQGFARQELNMSLPGHPDSQYIFYESFGIEESRGLEMVARRTALVAPQKVFVVGCRSMTSEAQNALLKLLEDPPPRTHFFLVIPSLSFFLPTLRSRLFLVRGVSSEVDLAIQDVASSFVAATIVDRLKIVTPIIEKKDRAAADAFINSVESVLSRDAFVGSTPLSVAQALREVLLTRKYLSDRAASLKLLLEHLALVLPMRKHVSLER